MKKIYACLVGEWVCLSDEPDCVIVDCGKSPNLWWEENAEAHFPLKRTQENSLYDMDYINISYRHKTYRIHPSFIQVVEE